MSAKVTYWCGVWAPGMEAMSREVRAVRRSLSPHSPVVSFSTGQASGWEPSDRVLRLSGRRWLLLRLLAALLERRGELTHVWGGTGSWHLLRAVGRRPVVLTAAVDPAADPAPLPTRPARIVAESRRLARRLEEIAGDIPVSIVPPGIDLQRFRPRPLAPTEPLRVLFASTPAQPADIPARGIGLLVELARARPDMEVELLWRPWGDVARCQAALDELEPPDNLRVTVGRVRDMEERLQQSHVVACLFAPGHGKSCPSSVLEGLACGRPALVTETMGLAPELESARAGRAIQPTVEAAAAAIDSIRDDLPGYSARARSLAENTYDVRGMIESYREIYRQITR